MVQGWAWRAGLAPVWPPLRRPRSGLDSDSPGRGSQHFTLVHRICPLLPPTPHPGPPGHPFLLLTHQGLLSATRRDSGWGLFLASLLPAASPPAPSCPAFPGVRSPLPHLTARLSPCPPSHPPPPHPRTPDGFTVFQAWPLGHCPHLFSSLSWLCPHILSSSGSSFWGDPTGMPLKAEPRGWAGWG